MLTGPHDEHLGVDAVAAGAQDYLVKGQVDGELLARALRYAVERKRADERRAGSCARRELRPRRTARLERGLLPRRCARPGARASRTRYRPGRQRALLGGDFYDVVETADGRCT